MEQATVFTQGDLEELMTRAAERGARRALELMRPSLSSEEVAQMFSVSTRTVSRWVRERRLPPPTLGRWDREQLLRLRSERGAAK